MSILEQIQQAVLNQELDIIKSLTEQAVAEGLEPDQIINEGLIKGMNILGVKFKNNEVYIPEVLMAAEVMRIGTSVVKPLLTKEIEKKGVFVFGSVKGDMHDIGKNLVIMMVEGAGFKVIDLGVDVSVEKFIAAVEQHNPQVVGLSALLTTTMPQLDVTVKALKNKFQDIKVIVGGAPITAKYAEEIGADGYAPDAASAAETLEELIV